jgi:predicted peptidase
LVAQLSPDAIRIWREWPRAGQQVPSRATLSLPGGSETEVRYLLYLPADYSSSRKWPLLLFLHGSGERGDDLERVKRLCPPKMLARGKQLPMIVVSPQCLANSDWDNEQLRTLLDHLDKRFSIDPDQVFLSGYSMGGYAAWSLAAAAPERFAALVPVAGGGNLSDAKKLTNLAIWAFHGAKDSTVSPSETREMVDAIRAAGGSPRLTIYPDRRHDTCDITFSRADLYDWLLQQRRVK